MVGNPVPKVENPGLNIEKPSLKVGNPGLKVGNPGFKLGNTWAQAWKYPFSSLETIISLSIATWKPQAQNWKNLGSNLETPGLKLEKKRAQTWKTWAQTWKNPGSNLKIPPIKLGNKDITFHCNFETPKLKNAWV